jgi:DNA-binding NarL/FixJ family response regulator
MGELRILLVDDHEIVREGVRLLIEAQSDMSVVGEADNGEDAVKKTVELKPDLVVMDISMPQLNGLKATKKLCQINPQIKILILTRHEDIGYLRTLIEAGASGYILKQSAPADLIRAVRAVAAGKSYLDVSLTERVFDGFVNRSSSLRGENKAELTEREQQVLRLTAWGYSNKEIGVKLEISVKTVEAHKSNAMRKLDLQNRIDIVRFALLQGWLQDN